MARSKSIPGSKTRTSTTREQGVASDVVNQPDLKKVAAEPSDEVGPEAMTPEESSKPAVKATPESRKMEVVKNDPRKNLVPINLDDEIRRRAYELYQQRRPGSGSDAEDWLTAEREIRQRYRQQSA
jgi:hypothetical protein